MTTAVAQPASTWAVDLVAAARRFVAITLAGAVAGVVVGGLGGRLAMLLIARLNPAATGRISDDGFRIGQATVAGTLNLLAAGLFLGLLAAILFALLRPLMIGPRWFRLLSISLGPAVVVGSQLVHTTGVDFTALQPAALSIALFTLIPGLAVLLLVVLAERWLDEDAWPARARPWLLLPVLLLHGPLLVPVAALVGVWSLGWALRREPAVAPVLDHPAVPWVARGALAVVFGLALLSLVGDISVLT